MSKKAVQKGFQSSKNKKIENIRVDSFLIERISFVCEEHSNKIRESYRMNQNNNTKFERILE